MEGSVVSCGTKAACEGVGPHGPAPLRTSGVVVDVAAGGRGLQHALDTELECRRPQRQVLVARLLADLAVGAPHDLSEPLVHLVLLPAEVLEVLDPLEVRDDDAA